jgi:hypothetical protein
MPQIMIALKHEGENHLLFKTVNFPDLLPDELIGRINEYVLARYPEPRYHYLGCLQVLVGSFDRGSLLKEIIRPTHSGLSRFDAEIYSLEDSGPPQTAPIPTLFG